MPLALELAAARLTLFSVEQIAARLDDRFRLLTGGSRTAVPRQQTLQATMDWSYDLLADAERALLRRLSVFAGSFSFEAAEAVGVGAGVTADAILNLLNCLVDKSLVLVEDEPEASRYRLLETVRQYGERRLVEAGEVEPCREQHFGFYLDLAERAAPALRGPRPLQWRTVLECEQVNLRAALAWGLTEPRRAGDCLRLSVCLIQLWSQLGLWSEGRTWLERALSPGRSGKTPAAGSSLAPTPDRAAALCGAGMLAWCQGDFRAARAQLTLSLSIWRQLGDRRGTAEALAWSGGLARDYGDSAGARCMLDEAVAIARELSDPLLLGLALVHLGLTDVFEGQPAAARPRLEAALARLRESALRWAPLAIRGLAMVAGQVGDWAAARRWLESQGDMVPDLVSAHDRVIKGIELGFVLLRLEDFAAADARFAAGAARAEALGSRSFRTMALLGLGEVARLQGDARQAARLYAESLALHRRGEYPITLVATLEALGRLAVACKAADRAARLFGAADARLAGRRIPGLFPYAPHADPPEIAAACAALGEAAFAEAWAQGHAMLLSEAIAEADQIGARAASADAAQV